MNNRESFKNLGSTTPRWKIRADEMHEAAKLVWWGKTEVDPRDNGPDYIHHYLHRPTQLLMGLCLEITLKGYLSENDPELLKNGSVNKKLRTHNLEKLFNLAEIDLENNNDELEFIQRLSDAVEWMSKYPIPLFSEQLFQPKHAGKRSFVTSDKDFERFEKLREKIQNIINAS